MAAASETFIRKIGSRVPDLRGDQQILAAIDAVLGELGRYVSGDSAGRLAAELPEELRGALTHRSRRAEGSESADFFRGVAEREGIASDVAAEHVQAVFRAIAENVSADAVRGVRDQLTPELRRLLDQPEREGDTSQLMSRARVDAT